MTKEKIIAQLEKLYICMYKDKQYYDDVNDSYFFDYDIQSWMKDIENNELALYVIQSYMEVANRLWKQVLKDMK